MADKGRLQGADISIKTNTVKPKSATQAILLKQDEIIDALKALAAKLDADSGDTGGDSDYAASISDALAKIKLR